MRKTFAALLAACLAALLPTSAAFAACSPVAALPDTERRTTYSISSETGPFSVSFALLGDGTDPANWVEVWLNGTKLTYTTDWTFSLASGTVATACRPITNGRVTLVASSTGTLEIVGARRPRRTSQFTQGQGISARDFNQTFTDVVAQSREMWDLRSRLLIGRPGDSFNPLPAKSALASSVLGFDADGNPMAGTIGTTSIAVSAYISTLIDDVDAAAARATLGLTVGANVQAWDADLDAIAALGGTGGFAARTAANTWALRTLTGTANEITVTNGDGISGSPTFSLPTALTFTGKTITGGTYASPIFSGTPSSSGPLNFTGGASGASPTPQLTFADYLDNAGDPSISHILLGTGMGVGLTSNIINWISAGTYRFYVGGVLTTPAFNITGGGVQALNALQSGSNGVVGGSVKLLGATSGDATIKVPAAAGTATNFQLPANNGTANYHLITDGSGVTSWAAAATNSEIWSATSGKRVDAAGLNSAGQMVALSDAGTIATDMATGINFTVTLGGNRTLGAPTNTQAGRSGCYFITQDGTGGRTLAYDAVWKFPGGVDPVLTTAASAVDMLCYIVRDASNIYATLNADMK